MANMNVLRRTHIQISVDSFRYNVRFLKEMLAPQVKLMAVVKADAYGHGLIPMARAAAMAGADFLGLAIAEEGVALRMAGIDLPMLIFGALNQEGMLAAARHGLIITVFTPSDILNAQQAAIRAGKTLEIHIKIDTGMARIGLRTLEELQSVLKTIDLCPRLRLTGVFTHFADAQNADQSYTQLQLDYFKRLLQYVPSGLLIHAAASAALLMRPDIHFGMVRSGIALYGYPPTPVNPGFKPCLRFVAEVTYVKQIGEGESVSYGCTYHAREPITVATLAVGYADGYPRALSNKGRVLIRSHSCPVIGRVCMDQLMVDATGVPGVRAGDQAVLIGAQGDDFVGADELAQAIDTIPYEILLLPSPRVPKVYMNEVEQDAD
jgi:alanine racemase